MIQNDNEFAATQERIARFEQILLQIRVKAAPQDFPAMASGYLSELKKMQQEVWDYLCKHPEESAETKEAPLAVK